MSKTKRKNQNKDEKVEKKTQQNEQQKNDTKFNTDWDVEKYRREYESEEHWQLRKRFMEVHKNKFNEDKLVCLAQVFTNMEFMGCKYPAETMRMVAELSKEVAKEFRAERANRLKRTFVAASDAAEARAKGCKSAQSTNNVQSSGPSQQGNNQRKGFGSESDPTNNVLPSSSTFQVDNNMRRGFGADSGEPLAKKVSLTNIDLFSGLKYGEFVLYLHGDRNCLRLSAQRSNVQYFEKEIVENGRKKVEIRLNDELVASACEENIKATKAEAFRRALATLQEHCYTIQQNPFRDTIKIEKTKNKLVCGVIKTQQEGQELDCNNKGYRMMKLMGWTGGGLGSKKQGVEDPVGSLLKINRSGLGNNDCKLLHKYFMQIIKNYVESNDIRELQFEPTFTKEERVMLHEIAIKFNLKSTSQGPDKQRRLIIDKKRISDIQILQEILINKNPSFMDRYLVQVPLSKSQLFPDYTVALTL